MISRSDSLRSLPSVDEMLREAQLAEARANFPHSTVTNWIRQSLDDCRRKILESDGESSCQWRSVIVDSVMLQMKRQQGIAIQAVINATGIILHTNLGRAPLAASAVERVIAACGYSNVELDLYSGKRAQRGLRATQLISELTGAEDAVVVNNCAAATLLVLQTFAADREVLIARGQLVEIGGGFRLPDVFRTAGVVLREVGTTNRTYLADYQSAVGDDTGAIIRVHHSNFRMSGFVTEPSIGELVSVERSEDIPVIDDLGSGWIQSGSELLMREPSVDESVKAGADVTLFSGDKLFGGPQCGIILGKREWIGRLRKSPLMRALRVDKLTLAALEATTEIHLADRASADLPALAMLASTVEAIRSRCERVAGQLGEAQDRVEIVECLSQTGGGSIPGHDLPSYGLRIETDSPDKLAQLLRSQRPAVQSRIHADCVLLDLRTVAENQCEQLAKGLIVAIREATAEEDSA